MSERDEFEAWWNGHTEGYRTARGVDLYGVAFDAWQAASARARSAAPHDGGRGVEKCVEALRTARGWVEDGYPSRAIGVIDSLIEMVRGLALPATPTPSVAGETLPPEYDRVMADVVKKGDMPSINAALSLHAKMVAARSGKPSVAGEGGEASAAEEFKAFLATARMPVGSHFTSWLNGATVGWNAARALREKARG